MPKYKVNVEWSGENEAIDDFENEKEAEEYGYGLLADGCCECNVYVELIEDEDEDEEESD